MLKKISIAFALILTLFVQSNVSYANKSDGGPEVIVRLDQENKHKLNSDIYYGGNMLNNRVARIFINGKAVDVDIEDINNYTLKRDIINVLDNKQVDIVQLLNTPGELYHNADILTSLHKSDINILRSEVVKKLNGLNISDTVEFINNNLNIHQFVSNATKHPDLFSTAGKTINESIEPIINCSTGVVELGLEYSILHDINNNTSAINNNPSDTNVNTDTSIGANDTNVNTNLGDSGQNENNQDSNDNNSGQILRPLKLNYPKKTEQLNSQQTRLLLESKKYLGTQYVWGGNSLTNGVDCSGFTRELYKLLDISMPRVSRDQAKSGKHVDIENIKVGDLIFFKSSPSDKQIGHVGMYIGNGEFIHASSGSAKVVISSLDNIWYSNCFVSVRRYL